MKIFELIPEFVDEIPENIKAGILYITEIYGTTVHLCACGCGDQTVTDLQPVFDKGYILTKNNDKVTLRPSIGNWKGQNPYHAHYYITNNKIEWL